MKTIRTILLAGCLLLVAGTTAQRAGAAARHSGEPGRAAQVGTLQQKSDDVLLLRGIPGINLPAAICSLPQGPVPWVGCEHHAAHR